MEVTSYSFAATGAYRIGVTLVDQRSVRTGQSIEGELRGSGDEYLLVGTPGETVTIELESFDFDTYLELTDPSEDAPQQRRRRGLFVVAARLRDRRGR